MTWRHVILFLAVTFTWSWSFWALPVLLHHGVALPPALADLATSGTPAAWGPLVGAIVTALSRGGWPGLWSLLKRGVRLGFGWPWWGIVLLLFPVLIGGSYAIALLLGEDPVMTEAMARPWVMIPAGFVFILLNGGPLQEEFGWRGTLTDPMQDRFGALAGSLIVGATWGLWHLPLFYFPNDAAPFYARPFWGLLVSCIMISVLFTWVWNNTGGSVAAVMLLHTTYNLSHWTLPVIDSDTAALILFAAQFAAVGAVIAVFGHRRLTRQSG